MFPCLLVMATPFAGPRNRGQFLGSPQRPRVVGESPDITPSRLPRHPGATPSVPSSDGDCQVEAVLRCGDLAGAQVIDDDVSVTEFLARVRGGNGNDKRSRGASGHDPRWGVLNDETGRRVDTESCG